MREILQLAQWQHQAERVDAPLARSVTLRTRV
jgi:hypothetical protein